MGEAEELQKIEEELKKLEGISPSYGSPSSPAKDTIFRFFRHIIDSVDSRKTGNLKDSELGMAKMGVRHYFEIAAYAEAEKLPKVAEYLATKAEIVLSTSMSRKGFLSQLFVTQIKREKKDTPKAEPKKWFWNKPEGEQ